MTFAAARAGIRSETAIDWKWWLARRYTRVWGRVKDLFGINLPGLGRLHRRVRQEHVFELADQQMLFDPAVAGAYARLIVGEFNEPATYQFLINALQTLSVDATFVNVGANVGEFLIPVAAHPRIKRAIGYEPLALCAAVCMRSAQLNRLENVELRSALVGDGTVQQFRVDEENPNASGIGPGPALKTVRLDDDLLELQPPVIMLIDVEGAEPLVLEGAKQTIARTRPLIIFEYNYESRAHYHISKVASLLGDDYMIYRLRDDARLDGRLEKSWNCVALPKTGAFAALSRLVKDGAA